MKRDSLLAFVLCTLLSVLGLSVLGSPLGALTLDKGPYLQHLTGESVYIVWETLDSASGHIRYGTTAGLTERTPPTQAGTHHEIQLQSLAAGTQYYYALYQDDLAQSEVFSFRTDPGPDQPFRFILNGDNRSDPDAHQQVVDAMLTEPNVGFIVNSGDMVGDGEEEDQWVTFFQVERQLLARYAVLPTIGNHEEDDGDVSIWERLFINPTEASSTEHFYSYTYGNSRFLVLDGHVNVEPWYLCLLRLKTFDDCFLEEQEEFVDAALAAAQADPEIAHTFVVIHAGPYSSKDGRTGNAQMRNLLPKFLEYGVDLILSGHDHYYEHGISGNGIDYIISGGGGAPLYRANPSATNFLIPHEPLSTNSILHYVVIDVSGDSIQVTTKGVDGTVLDQFAVGERVSCTTVVDCANASPGACAGQWGCEDDVCRWLCDPPPSCDEPSDCPTPPEGFCPGEWRCSLHRCEWTCTGGECSIDADCAGIEPLNDCWQGYYQCMDDVCEWVCPPQPDAGLPDAAPGDSTIPADSAIDDGSTVDTANGDAQTLDHALVVDSSVASVDGFVPGQDTDAAEAEKKPDRGAQDCGCAAGTQFAPALLLVPLALLGARRRHG